MCYVLCTVNLTRKFQKEVKRTKNRGGEEVGGEVKRIGTCSAKVKSGVFIGVALIVGWSGNCT
jgi:hypothetical protein